MDWQDRTRFLKSHTSVSLRVGRIRYLNTLPFYHGLENVDPQSPVELKWTVGSPAEMNHKMNQGEIDLAPVSSLEYLNHQGDYLLFPDLCIGSRDFSASVLLLSKKPPEVLGGAKISLSEESLSAATLLKILLKEKWNVRNEFVVEPSSPKEMLKGSEGCLVIGDEALFFRPEEFVYKTDLSQVWWNWVGFPFCFSVWAVRRDCYRCFTDEVNSFYRALKTNVTQNLQDLEVLLREGAGMTLTDERFPTAFGYLFNLGFGLDETMKEGLLLFFDHAHKLGVSPAPGPLEFIEA